MTEFDRMLRVFQNVRKIRVMEDLAAAVASGIISEAEADEAMLMIVEKP